MRWKDLINTHPKRSNFVKVKRDSKLILTENITSINVFNIIALYFATYFGLYLNGSKSYIDAAGKVIENGGEYMFIFFIAAFIFTTFQSAVYKNKDRIYHDSVLNRISKGKLITVLVIGLVILLLSLIAMFCSGCILNTNTPPAPIAVLFTPISMYALASMIFIYSLIQVVLFYKNDKFSAYIALSIITLIIISALGILKENAVVACTAGTLALMLNTVMNYRNS
jgi:hypothetical protein